METYFIYNKFLKENYAFNDNKVERYGRARQATNDNNKVLALQVLDS